MEDTWGKKMTDQPKTDAATRRLSEIESRIHHEYEMDGGEPDEIDDEFWLLSRVRALEAAIEREILAYAELEPKLLRTEVERNRMRAERDEAIEHLSKCIAGDCYMSCGIGECTAREFLARVKGETNV
jgi:hypothetical protein